VEGVAARVRLYVLDHMILADEAFTAHLAHEGFLASVQTHMASQVRLVVELFGAEWAFVGLIAGVLLLVLAEQFRILEALAAHVAFEWFVTFVERVVVLRQVAHPIEGFVTLGALEGAHCVASVAACSGHCHPFGHHWNGRRLGITGVELVTGQRRVLARQFRIAFQHVHQVVLAVLHTVVVVVAAVAAAAAAAGADAAAVVAVEPGKLVGSWGDRLEADSNKALHLTDYWTSCCPLRCCWLREYKACGTDLSHYSAWGSCRWNRWVAAEEVSVAAAVVAAVAAVAAVAVVAAVAAVAAVAVVAADVAVEAEVVVDIRVCC